MIFRTLPLNYGKTFSALMVKKYLDSVDFMVKNVLDLVTIKKSEIQKKIRGPHACLSLGPQIS